jgi:hypothetical protein
MRRELRNEKYPFNYTDFASLNLRIYTFIRYIDYSKFHFLFTHEFIHSVLFLVHKYESGLKPCPQYPYRAWRTR